MKKLVFTLTALVLLAGAAPAPSHAEEAEAADQWRDVDVQALTESAPDRQDYPDAAGLFLNLQEMADVQEDGSVITLRNRLIKVLTLRGRERYSNQSFLFDIDTDELEIVKGVTVRKTGRVIEVEEDAVNDVTPSFLQDASIYANVFSKVISFPVAGPGATMELQLKKMTLPADDGSFSGIEYLGAMDPVFAAEFTLRYPDETYSPVTAAFDGALGRVNMKKSSGPGEMTYSVSDVPACVEEEFMPSTNELFPRVLYSSYSSWDEPSVFFAGKFFPHVETDGAIADHVAEVTEELARDDAVRAIFMDVATGVRNIHLSLGLGGYEPNDASQVLANKYADTRDKAVLLVSMLRAAGFEAYPVLVQGRTDATFVPSVPTLKQFDRILVLVPEDGGPRFLDPFLDDAFYGFVRWGRGNTALLVRDDGTGELVDVPGFSSSDNVSRQHMRVVISDDGSADIEASCELTGYFDRKTRMDLKDATPIDEEKAFDSAASRVSVGATSESYSHSDLADLTEPVTVQQSIHADGLAVPQGDMMIVHLPPFPHDFARTGVAARLAERSYPFEFPCEFESVLEMELTLPDGYEVVWMPESITLATDQATMALSCEASPGERTVVWKRTFTVNERTVPVDAYEEFKESSDKAASPKIRLLLLKKV